MNKQLTREAALSEVERLTSKPNFNKGDAARCEYLMRLAAELNPAINELRKMRLAELSAESAVNDPGHAEKYRLTPGVRELNEVERNFDIAIRQGKEVLPAEARALAVGTGSQGGYLVPQTFADQ